MKKTIAEIVSYQVELRLPQAGMKPLPVFQRTHQLLQDIKLLENVTQEQNELLKVSSLWWQPTYWMKMFSKSWFCFQFSCLSRSNSHDSNMLSVDSFSPFPTLLSQRWHLNIRVYLLAQMGLRLFFSVLTLVLVEELKHSCGLFNSILQLLKTRMVQCCGKKFKPVCLQSREADRSYCNHHHNNLFIHLSRSPINHPILFSNMWSREVGTWPSLFLHIRRLVWEGWATC